MRSPKPQINREISGRQAAEKGCLRSVLNAMNRLLKLTAIIEAATGLGLAVVPCGGPRGRWPPVAIGRHRLVAGGGSPRGHGRLVCCVPAG